MNYLVQLRRGKMVLWCYLIWYLSFVAYYFDPSRHLWLTSIGLSGVVGFALLLSTTGGNSRLDRWQVFRLFLMPFCVSSFSALVKGRGFILIFSPNMRENVLAFGLCASFCAFVLGLKLVRR